MCSLCGTLYCVKNKKLQRVNLENEAVVGKCSVCGDDLVGWEVELYSTKCVICTAVDG